jgi:hypothetical protein
MANICFLVPQELAIVFPHLSRETAPFLNCATWHKNEEQPNDSNYQDWDHHLPFE